METNFLINMLDGFRVVDWVAQLLLGLANAIVIHEIIEILPVVTINQC